MKEIFLRAAWWNGAKRINMGLGFTLAAMFLHFNASADDVNLGTANSFAVLATSTITSTGPTAINGGNVGLYPDALTSITGFPPGTLASPYSFQAANAVAAAAGADALTAYNTLKGEAVNGTLTGQNLGGQTLTPGVYFFASSAQLTGTLTLNGEGQSDPFFDIQIGSTLTTASDSSILLLNGAQAGNVFWQVGSAATLGTGTAFQGNILAEAAISDNGGSTVDGRLLVLDGAVTLIDTTVNAPQAGGIGGAVPDAGSTLLLFGSALAALFAFGRRFSVLLR